MATETSVVVALKEVRRLELERQRREEEARRSASDARDERMGDRASLQFGPGMMPLDAGWDGNGNGRPVHRTSEVMPVAGSGFTGPGLQSFVGGQTPPAWEGPGFAAPPQVIQTRSPFKAVLLTFLVCGAAAAGGLWKLNGDHARALSAIEASRQRVEAARNDEVASRSKVEQELKLKVAELQGKLDAATAKAGAASAALALAARNAGPPAAAAAPPAAPAPLTRAGRRRARAAAAAAAKATVAAPLPKAPPPTAPPAGPSPKVAKKKSLSDDPLGGLRL